MDVGHVCVCVYVRDRLTAHTLIIHCSADSDSNEARSCVCTLAVAHTGFKITYSKNTHMHVRGCACVRVRVCAYFG